jgi:rubrerythrin
MDLSILIPSRNEEFLKNTIEDILAHIEADTEVIAVLDGKLADPAISQHERVTLIYHPESIGQRAATNEAASVSRAKFIMKCDAHCAFDQGFDRKLMEEWEYNWTVVPRMYNLHVFDWECGECGNRTYQGPKPEKCEKCDNSEKFERLMVWKPRRSRKSDFARFDNTMRFKYWGAFGKRPEGQGDIADLMCHVGACWGMHRDRYWELGGCDEEHGSWGQMGVEISCKSWLSGGRQVVNKRTWFSHMFRTQPGFGFPYKISGRQVNNAMKYSRGLWMGDNWPQAVHTLDWLLEKFRPVPTWHDSKAIVYYTDNRLDESLMSACQTQLRKAAGDIPIISVSLKPIDFGDTCITLDKERGHLTMFQQILAGIEAADADVVYFAEHDVLYHPSHFEFMPTSDKEYYYNENVWKLRMEDGHALHCICQQTSGLCAYRKLLLGDYK